MRVLSLEKIKSVTKNSNAAVAEVVQIYNSKPENSNRLAIKGGTRKTRCTDEAKVLSRFDLK